MMTFIVAETRAKSFSYHLRDASAADARRAVCGDRVDLDTSIPIEAWEAPSDKSIITKWCPRCKIAVAAQVAEMQLMAAMPRPGNIVYFQKCSVTLKKEGKIVGFKGHGFGVMLGIVPTGAPEPPLLILPRLLGESGYLSFDDVIAFFGEEVGKECVEKFKDKYYGKVVLPEDGEIDIEGRQVKNALRLVDSSGKPMELLPGPKEKQ